MEKLPHSSNSTICLFEHAYKGIILFTVFPHRERFEFTKMILLTKDVDESDKVITYINIVFLFFTSSH